MSDFKIVAVVLIVVLLGLVWIKDKKENKKRSDDGKKD
jgi:hypothetical protein